MPRRFDNENVAVEDTWNVLEITDFAGINTRDHALGIDSDQFISMQNMLVVGLGIEKRLGSVLFGSVQSATKVVGLGALDQDSGLTQLMLANQTLYKYVSSDWIASDKTDYTINTDAVIETFTSKGGSSVDSGTTSSGSTQYLLEDASKNWTPGEHQGRCVVIEGEVKYISDNSKVVLYLSDKLNGTDDSLYKSKAYAIHELSPHAIICNGVDSVQKYDLTTTTPIDGTHVTGGKALPIAKYATQHQGRMFYARGSKDKNDRVDISDVGVAENVTVDTNLNFNTQFYNDGQSVTGIVSLPTEEGSVLVATKERSVHTLDGDNVLNYRTHPRIRRTGCIAPKTLKVAGRNAFFLSDEGVISLDTAANPLLDDPVPISRSIQNQIDAKTDAERSNACAEVQDNRYYLWIGTSAWYYDIEASLRQQKHVWVDLNYPYAANVMANIDGVLYMGSQSDGQIYQLGSTNQDNVINVEGSIETGRISLPGRPLFWVERIEIIAETDSSSILRCSYAKDGAAYPSTHTPITLDETNNRYVWQIQERVYDIKLKIRELGSNAPVRFVPPIRIFYSRSDFGESGTKG